MPAELVPVLWLVAGILICGAIVYALGQLPGIDAAFLQVARIILILVLVVWAILVIMGLITGTTPSFPRAR
jgi:hypothetical protein